MLTSTTIYPLPIKNRMNKSPYPPYQQPNTNTVQVFDRGMQMNMCIYQLPTGWCINQDIVTNPYDVHNPMPRFFIELIGPKGEWIRGVKPSIYYPMWGQRFETVWQHGMYVSMGNTFQQVQMHQIEASPDASRLFRAHELPIQSYGFQMRLSGQIHGYPIEGMSYTLTMGDQYAASVLATVVICPAGILSQTLQTFFQIESSRVQNRQREQLYMQIFSQASQQLMASRQAAHQQRMQAQYAAMDQHNRQWREQFYNTGWSSGSSSVSNSPSDSYSSNDAFLDYIRDTTTFYDEYVGHNVQVDGQYDYWYSNGLGQYYGTNDPNFNATVSLGLNWDEVKPLGRY